MTNTYLQNLLAKNEQVKMITHQHWVLLLREILLEVGSIVVIVLLTTLVWLVWWGNPIITLAYLFLLLPIASLVKDILAWKNHQFIITNRRVIQIFGILTKNVTDSSLEKVNDVKMVQSVWGRLFNFGDIEILTASELGINRFTRLAKPIEFKTAMLDAKEEMKNAVLEESLPGRNLTPQDLLLALHQSGVIPKDEFEKFTSRIKSNQPERDK